MIINNNCAWLLLLTRTDFSNVRTTIIIQIANLITVTLIDKAVDIINKITAVLKTSINTRTYKCLTVKDEERKYQEMQHNNIYLFGMYNSWSEMCVHKSVMYVRVVYVCVSVWCNNYAYNNYNNTHQVMVMELAKILK